MNIFGIFVRALIKRKIATRNLNGNIPLVLGISPTLQCNYHCKGCYALKDKAQNELSSEELDCLLSEAENLGIPSIVVTGGEPFLREDFFSAIEKHRKLLFVVVTNGTLLTTRSAKRVAKSKKYHHLNKH